MTDFSLGYAPAVGQASIVVATGGSATIKKRGPKQDPRNHGIFPLREVGAQRLMLRMSRRGVPKARSGSRGALDTSGAHAPPLPNFQTGIPNFLALLARLS